MSRREHLSGEVSPSQPLDGARRLPNAEMNADENGSSILAAQNSDHVINGNRMGKSVSAFSQTDFNLSPAILKESSVHGRVIPPSSGLIQGFCDETPAVIDLTVERQQRMGKGMNTV